MTDQEAVQWINKNAPAEMRWWIHDRLRYPPTSLATMSKKWKCPTCGTKQELPHRPPVGTQVVHRKLGLGVIMTYDHCDDVSCIVEFREGDWCIRLNELTPKP